jgi:hypothetical protein
LEVAPYLPRRDHRFEALLHHRKPVGAPSPTSTGQGGGSARFDLHQGFSIV